MDYPDDGNDVEKVGLDFSQHDEHYGLAHIGERELAEYEEHIREKNK